AGGYQVSLFPALVQFRTTMAFAGKAARRACRKSIILSMALSRDPGLRAHARCQRVRSARGGRAQRLLMSADRFCNEETPFAACRSPLLVHLLPTIPPSQAPPITLISGPSRNCSGHLHSKFLKQGASHEPSRDSVAETGAGAAAQHLGRGGAYSGD